MDTWQQILRQLKLSIPPTTFNCWLADTTQAAEAENTLTVYARPEAQAWINHQLHPIIAAATLHVCGRSIEIVYQTPPAQPQPIMLKIVHWDPTQAGFTIVSNYAAQFWQPLIGCGPFSLWTLIRSYARDAGNPAGKSTFISVTALAAVLSNGNRQILIGRKRGPTRWQPGWIQILEQHHILTWHRAPTLYHWHVLGSLPLLSPAQVNTLSTNRRAAHARFLTSCELTDDWQQLDLPSLATAPRP